MRWSAGYCVLVICVGTHELRIALGAEATNSWHAWISPAFGHVESYPMLKSAGYTRLEMTTGTSALQDIGNGRSSKVDQTVSFIKGILLSR